MSRLKYHDITAVYAAPGNLSATSERTCDHATKRDDSAHQNHDHQRCNKERSFNLEILGHLLTLCNVVGNRGDIYQ
jgi:hypothetical protein